MRGRVVPPETTLFFGAVYDNLLLANPNALFEGKVTMLFITHRLPRKLCVNGIIRIGGAAATEGLTLRHRELRRLAAELGAMEGPRGNSTVACSWS